MLAPLRRMSPGLRRVIASTFLLGVGQQMFVVVRNPLLAELGFRPEQIPRIQAVGALAGVFAGVVTLGTLHRWRTRTIFASCAALQTIGFALQAVSSTSAGFLMGAVVAGLAIQLNTAAIPPILHRLSREEDSATTFTVHAIALSAGAGLVAAAVVTVATRWSGESVGAHRLALTAAALVSLFAVVAFLRIEDVSLATLARPRLARRDRVVLCVALQGLTAFAAGIMLPFLPLYIKLTHGLRLESLGYLHAGTMAAGTVSFAVAPLLVARFGLVRTIVGLQFAVLPMFMELATTTRPRLAVTAFVARHVLATTVAPLASAFYQRVSYGRDGEAVAGLGMVTSSVTWTVGSWLAGPLVAQAQGQFRLALLVSALLYGLVAMSGMLLLPHLWRTRPEARPLQTPAA